MQVNSVPGAGGTIPPAPPAHGGKRSSDVSLSETALPTVDVPPPPQHARGVIRLLQEGHFNGVADVRLRINFADELAALQTQSNARVVAVGPDAIIAGADAVITDFLAQNDVNEEAIVQIQAARNTFADAIGQAFAAPDSTPQSLVDALSAAINDFLGSIQALIPADTSANVETTVVDNAAAVPVETATLDTPGVAADSPLPPFGQLIELLREALDAIVSDLQTQFESAQILPELSSPNGNGRAYDKFVAILNGLTSQDSGSVDTAA